MPMKPWTVHEVRKPCKPGYEGKWCVYAYHTTGKGISFWYYDTEAEAQNIAREHNEGKDDSPPLP